MSQHLDMLKVCERINGRCFKYIFLPYRNNNTVAEKKQLYQRKHGKKHYFLLVSLEEVVFGEGNCRGNRKLRADPA